MKKNLLKTMLVAGMLTMGMSASAGDKTVVKYSFDNATSPSLTAGSRVSFDYDKTSVITSTKFLNAFNNTNGDPGASTLSLGSTDLSAETWTLSFEWAACGGCNSKPDHTTLKAGDTNLFDLTGNSNWNTTVTITYAGSDGTQTLPVPGCNKSYRFSAATGNQYNTTDYWHHIVVTGSASGVTMTITNSSTGAVVVENVVLSETNVNPTSMIIEPCCGGAIGLDELSLTYYVEGEVIQTPIAAYTAVDGISRTITATCDTEGATLYYSTDGENWTEGAVVTVSESGNVYFKAVKGTSESDVLTFAAVAGEAIVLNAPVIDRTSNTSVTITADQTNLLLSPDATIVYEYGSQSGTFTGSMTLTVEEDAVITAYAEFDGYTNSETSQRAVALFPVYVEQIENTASRTSGWSTNAFSEETITASERTYAALMLDDEQWGQNVYLQTDGAWGFRASGNWYINSADAESWILMQNMKKGDIIVVNVTYPASSTVNATYSKYSFGTQHAYEVTEDGNVELAFKKINATTMDYLYGVYSYRVMTNEEINEFNKIEISPEEGDIAAALTAAKEGKTVGNIIINLTAGAAYTISSSIEAPANITINGNGATIDASALTDPFIAMANVESPTTWTETNVNISSISVKGLKNAMFYSTCKNYLIKDFIVDNCFVEVAGDATTFDFTKGSVAVNFNITNSTFYAPTATTKQFYSSQAGQKATEAGDYTQTFTFKNNTMYNLAKSKNFFTHRQNSQKWLTYVAENNIFVNCGKKGQTIKGLNGGGSSANPTWTISGNAFNFDGADTSANEETGDAEEPVQESIAGVVTFTDAANGDFNGIFVLADNVEAPASLGDKRWTLSITTGIEAVSTSTVNDTVIYDLQGRRVQNAQSGLYIVNGRKVVIK